MTTRQLRLLRAASASTVATVLAAVSHTVAGGAAPHPLLIVAMAVLLVPAAALLVGPRTSRPRVALAVLVSQAAFHTVFQMLGAPTAGSTIIGHQHHLDLTALGPAVTVAAPDALMLGAHVLAALATTALLWHGESLILSIARWIVARIRRGTASAAPEPRRPPLLVSLLAARVDPALLASLSRRGPPVLV